MPVSKARIQGLDTVRALAALSVMFAHLAGPFMPGFSKYLFTGMPAVVAFFVVSGFCIHYPYRELPVPVRAFWIARAVRILVPSVSAMALAAAAGVKEYDFVNGYILWSIVCELFYYACYPLLLVLARMLGWRALWAVSFVISYVIVCSIKSDQFGNVHNYGWWLNWIVLLPTWLIGCLLADEIRTDKALGGVWAWRAATGCTASFLYWSTFNFIGFNFTMNAFALLVVFWVRSEISAAKENPSLALEWVGRWSYSLYLVHVIVAAFLAIRLRIENPMIVIPAALACSYAFYVAVERPAHNNARRVFKYLSMSMPGRPATNAAANG